MQLDLDVCGLNPRKLKAGCDGLRVRILTKIHSVSFARLCELRKDREEAQSEAHLGLKTRFWDLLWLCLERYSRAYCWARARSKCLRASGSRRLLG